MKIYVKKIEGITLPQQGSELSAGYDIVATSDPKIIGKQYTSHEDTWESILYIEYETNLFIAPNVKTIHTLIYPRSSISKYNLMLANGIGLIDNDYRGMAICRFNYLWQPEDLKLVRDEVEGFTGKIVGHVDGDKIYKMGDKIAQLVFEQTSKVEFELVDDLPTTQRGEGGFGSSDSVKIHPKNEDIKITPGSTITERYVKSGGIPTKERYSEEIKKRKEV